MRKKTNSDSVAFMFSIAKDKVTKQFFEVRSER